MTEYAIIVDNILKYAPPLTKNSCVLNGYRIFNPQLQDYINAGYKPLIYETKPEIPLYKKLDTIYTDTENEILVSYELIDMTEIEKQEYNKKILLENKNKLLLKSEEAKKHIEESYINALNTQFSYNEYLVKPMFLDKYSKAYISLLDDIDSGISPQVVNVSIYTDVNTLINIDLTFEEFKDIYRAVKEKALLIEKEYQQALVRLTELLQETDLNILEEKINEILNINIGV